MENVLDCIQQKFDHLSKGQKKIASYIFKNYDKAAYITASKLADIVGVSESTVVRFAMALGYEGYPDLQKALQESIKTKLTAVQRFKMCEDMSIDAESIKKIMLQDMDNIQKTIDMIDTDEFKKIIDVISKSKKTFLMGNRISGILGSYFGFYLNFIVDDLHIVHSGGGSSFDELINIDEDDCLIVISFPRYAKGSVDALKFVKSQGATIIGITDGYNSPIADLVDYALYGRYNMNTFIDSMVAPMSLINTMILALSLEKKDAVDKNLKKLDALWQRYGIYDLDNDSDKLKRG